MTVLPVLDRETFLEPGLTMEQQELYFRSLWLSIEEDFGDFLHRKSVNCCLHTRNNYILSK
jgi:hypothetical protein